MENPEEPTEKILSIGNYTAAVSYTHLSMMHIDKGDYLAMIEGEKDEEESDTQSVAD